MIHLSPLARPLTFDRFQGRTRHLSAEQRARIFGLLAPDQQDEFWASLAAYHDEWNRMLRADYIALPAPTVEAASGGGGRAGTIVPAPNEVPRANVVPIRGRRERRDDPLLEIPPPVYFERLTGREVARSGMVLCPAHDERTPSCKVYDEPERGFYCWGCGVGGTIYDLAAAVWKTSTRGEAFKALRRELLQEMAT